MNIPIRFNLALMSLLLLCVTDGALAESPLDPVLLRDIQVGPGDSRPDSFCVSGSYLYFRAATSNDTDYGNVGYEIWRTDGSPEGTILVADTVPGPGNTLQFRSSFYDPVDLDGTVLFPAGPSGVNLELWKTTGATAVPVYAGLGPTEVVFLNVINHKVYFSGKTSATGNEIFSSDGTVGGLTAFDLLPGSTDSGAKVLGQFPDGRVAINATATGLGRELWVSDGTTTGTMFFKDLLLGSVGSNPSNFRNVLGHSIFPATGPEGTEVWTSDGTTSGTQLLKDILPGVGNSAPTLLGEYNGSAYFAASDNGVTGNYELWISDGTTSGTRKLKEINPTGGSSPGLLTIYRGKAYFDALDGPGGYELWVTDGTEDGTQKFIDLRASSPGGRVFHTPMVEFEGLLYLGAADADSFELWRTDGTVEGTKKVTNLVPGGFPGVGPGIIRNGGGPTGSEALPVAVINGKLIFSARSSSTGLELWALPTQQNAAMAWRGYD